MNRKLILMCLLVFCLCSYAQQVTKGQVTDKAGNPISGARVEVKGTSLYTTTGIDGRFTLETPMMIDKVRVSSAGKVTKNVDVTPNMVVVMKPTSFWSEKPSKYQFFVSPQVTIPNSKISDVPFGVMVGIVKNIGLYARFVTSGQPSTDFSLSQANNGMYYSPKSNLYWTERKTGYQALTGGLIIRLGSPIYFTLGAGSVKRKVALKHLGTGKWIDDDKDNRDSHSVSGLGVEAGVMVRFGHFVINGGSTLWNMSEGYFCTNLGVGYMF
ncbi:MAG: carboxypeptidase regulatory-like domain-containing protein [Prevotella sp.]|nr:carboxypeptidase regulatory-like domain-containing protein [Prevotella sp.]MBP5715133.1 carboxypeptidase regulatory-like domain-containing protein [Prevotella sp.]